MEDFRTSYIVLEYSRNLVSVTIMSITCLQMRWLKLSKANPNSNSTRVEVRHSSHLEPTPHQPTRNPKLFTFNTFDNPLFGLNELFGLNSVENFRIRFKRIIRLKS